MYRRHRTHSQSEGTESCIVNSRRIAGGCRQVMNMGASTPDNTLLTANRFSDPAPAPLAVECWVVVAKRTEVERREEWTTTRLRRVGYLTGWSSSELERTCRVGNIFLRTDLSLLLAAKVGINDILNYVLHLKYLCWAIYISIGINFGHISKNHIFFRNPGNNIWGRAGVDVRSSQVCQTWEHHNSQIYLRVRQLASTFGAGILISIPPFEINSLYHSQPRFTDTSPRRWSQL